MSKCEAGSEATVHIQASALHRSRKHKLNRHRHSLNDQRIAAQLMEAKRTIQVAFKVEKLQ